MPSVPTEPSATELLIDLIRLELGHMTKTEIRSKYRNADFGSLREWALWNWRERGL